MALGKRTSMPPLPACITAVVRQTVVWSHLVPPMQYRRTATGGAAVVVCPTAIVIAALQPVLLLHTWCMAAVRNPLHLTQLLCKWTVELQLQPIWGAIQFESVYCGSLMDAQGCAFYCALHVS